MTLDEISDTAINPALAWLPAKMDTPDARVMLIAIGLQESRFEYRRQMGNGPAMGFWQFERGGGVKGVLTHLASKKLALEICSARNVAPNPVDVWQRLQTDDVLAAVFARLLLWTDAGKLPYPDDESGAWDLYLHTWRPGKPHPQTWPRFHAQAREFVG